MEVSLRKESTCERKIGAFAVTMLDLQTDPIRHLAHTTPCRPQKFARSGAVCAQ